MRLAVLLAILALPLLEIALLIKIGSSVGILGVLGLVLATAIVGVGAIRRHGLSTAMRLQEALEQGRSPGSALADHALVAVGGLLLVAPGVLTDILGGLLLIGPLRRALAAWAFGRLEPAKSPGGPGDAGDIIEGEFERLDERDTAPRRPRDPRLLP